MNQEEEKYNSIINWFIGPQGLEQHVPEMIRITSRLAKNFGIFSDDFDFSASRNPVLQYQEELITMANTLLQISSKVLGVNVNSITLPSSSKDQLNNRSSQKDMYNWLLSQRIKEFNFILSKIEEIITEKFYRYVGIVNLDYVRKQESDKKILFQTIEIAESAKKNLKRIEKYIIVKFNAPDPDMVYSLVRLESLKKYGFINQMQFDIRYENVIEQMITTFVTEGRFLEQEKQSALQSEDEAQLTQEGEEKLEELSLLFQEGFMDENEYRSRKFQLYENFSTRAKIPKPVKEEVKPVEKPTNKATSVYENAVCPYVGKPEPTYAETQRAQKEFGRQKIEMIVKLLKNKTCTGRTVFLNVYINNETKKRVNTVNIELTTMTGEMVSKADDVISETHSNQSALPIINNKWTGNLIFSIPATTKAEGEKFGNYKLIVKCIYETKYNIPITFNIELVMKNRMLSFYPDIIYDVPLITLSQRDSSNVPKIFSYLISLIAKNKSALTEEGIFRKSGSSTKLNEIRELIDCGVTIDWEKLLTVDGGVHNISGMFKLLLRYLPDPLFADTYDELMSIADNQVPVQRLEKYKVAMKKLPPQNFATISYFYGFLRTCIIPNEKDNKMSASNLSIVFGPSMLWKKNISEIEEMMNFKKVNLVVEELIKDSDKVF